MCSRRCVVRSGCSRRVRALVVPDLVCGTHALSPLAARASPACPHPRCCQTYDWTSSIKLIRIMLGFMFALIIGLSGIGFVGYGLLRETNAENRSMRGTGRSVAVCRLCAGALRPKTAAA